MVGLQDRVETCSELGEITVRKNGYKSTDLY